MTQRIGGVAFWYVNGTRLSLRGNFTVSPDIMERAGVAGLDDVHGYIETPVIPFMEGDVSLEPGTTVEDIQTIEDVTVTAELANGLVCTLSNAWKAGRVEINAHDGSFRVRLEGKRPQQFASG
jgi:hypothetical protein